MEYTDGISCVIVSYRSLETIKDCIESLQRQEGIEVEIIVIDNDSRDGTIEYLEETDVKKILLDENRGFGAAVNYGALNARYEYLFILNPDTEVPRDSLKRLYEIAESEPDLGILAPALVYPDGKPQLSARSLPSRREFFFGRGSPLYKLRITGEKEAGYIYPEGNEPVKVPAVSATAIMIKTELFNSLGGFDDRYFIYMEDIDLCRRIRGKGLSIVLVPEIKIKHSWRKSSSKRPFFAAWHHHLSVLKYFIKYDRKLFIMNLLLAIVLGFGLIFNFAVILLRKAIGR